MSVAHGAAGANERYRVAGALDWVAGPSPELLQDVGELPGWGD